jgi:hypothetical protein
MKTNFQSLSRFLLVLFVLLGSFLLTIETECQPIKLDLKKLPVIKSCGTQTDPAAETKSIGLPADALAPSFLLAI